MVLVVAILPDKQPDKICTVSLCPGLYQVPALKTRRVLILHQTRLVCILHAHANKSDFSRKPYAGLGAARL